ncbi:unnamed protein product [Meganyctiphanes norvegica]|uniref:Uncharacterized protein n=1 Tax=Meganyctiphanes norvegica TaxID=48144 RepID=A0AAV2RVL4_MEGNR
MTAELSSNIKRYVYFLPNQKYFLLVITILFVCDCVLYVHISIFLFYFFVSQQKLIFLLYIFIINYYDKSRAYILDYFLSFISSTFFFISVITNIFFWYFL